MSTLSIDRRETLLDIAEGEPTNTDRAARRCAVLMDLGLVCEEYAALSRTRRPRLTRAGEVVVSLLHELDAAKTRAVATERPDLDACRTVEQYEAGTIVWACGRRGTVHRVPSAPVGTVAVLFSGRNDYNYFVPAELSVIS